MPERPRSADIPDPIRAGETTDTGNLSESAAATAFARIGWPATLTTAAQDLGTDMLIAARDRRFHRGEYLGAQVKSGKSNLDSPIADGDGKHVGWFVPVKAKHANYWIDNALPHVLVLYDHTTDLCHWAHLTDETIKKTGKGRKVVVPVVQVVAPEQAEKLLAIAATARAPVPLEGTVWTGAVPKAPTDHLRFALIAPRLLAPHPNSGFGPTTAAEAVALLMQARTAEIWPFGRSHEDVPARQDAATSDVWAWRFVAALADWLSTVKEPDFETLRDEALSVHERAAVTAVIAHRSMAAGALEEARALLQSEVEADDLAPVDHAWLHLQLARAHQELANLDEARNAATLSLAVGSTQRHDVTATAIRGVAAAILFDTSTVGEYDIASTIRYSDTAVNWWRSQTAYRGAVALVETAFDRSVGHEPSDHDGIKANNQLFASSLQAGILGSHGQWRHFSGLLARQEFVDTQTPDVSTLAKSLGTLRRAGDERAARRATWWVATNGPADAVRRATQVIDLTRATSSSIVADLTTLRVAGDIVDEATATAAADWLRDALEDPTRLRALTHRMGYDPQQWIADKLEGIFLAIPREGAERTVSAIERYGADFGVLAERSWGGVLTAIPRWAWTADQAARLVALLPTFDEDDLVAAIALVGQGFDPTGRNKLLDLIRGDRVWALNYIDDLGDLTLDVVDEIRSICIARVETDCAAERDGTLARGSSRPLDSLVALTLAHPTDAAWDVVQQIVADPQMPAWYKQDAISRVASGRERIDGTRREALAGAIRTAGQLPPSDRWRGGDADLAAEAIYANIVLSTSPSDVVGEIARLAGGGTPHRGWAARLAGDAGEIGSLAILATDPSPLVRAEAAYGLARAAADGVDTHTVKSTLRQAIGDRGRATGLAVSLVFEDSGNSPPLFEARGLLADHPSAEVRRRAGRGTATDRNEEGG